MKVQFQKKIQESLNFAQLLGSIKEQIYNGTFVTHSNDKLDNNNSKITATVGGLLWSIRFDIPKPLSSLIESIKLQVDWLCIEMPRITME